MSGLVSVGLVLVLNALMHANGQHGLFLGMIFGVTVITAECEATGKKTTPYDDAHTLHDSLICALCTIINTGHNLLLTCGN